MLRLIWGNVRAIYGHWRGFCLGMVPFLLVFGAAQIEVDGKTLEVPIWLWISLGLFGLLVAQFLVYRDLAGERDSAKRELDELLASISTQSLAIEGANTLIHSPTMPPAVGSPVSVYLSFGVHNFGSVLLMWELIESSSPFPPDPNQPPIRGKGAEMPPGSRMRVNLPGISGLTYQPEMQIPVEFTMHYGPAAIGVVRRVWKKGIVLIVNESGTSKPTWILEKSTDELIVVEDA